MAKEPSFENALAFAQDLIRIPSLSGEEGEVVARIRKEMDALGYDEVTIDEVGNVIGVVSGRGEAPPVLLNCHVDVVAEGDPGEWEYPPFSGSVEGGYLHGRGSMDIKGPLAIQTYAAAARGGKAPGDNIAAHPVCEEKGGWGMSHLMKSGGHNPGAVIIGEATQGDIAIGHRGRGEMEVVIHGTAGHASAPERARNSLDLVPAVLAAIEEVAAGQDSDSVLGRASLVATGIDVLPESRNVIPDRVTVVGDWRVLPSMTDDGLIRTIEEAVRRQVGEGMEGLAYEVRMASETQTAYTGVSEHRNLFSPGFLMDGDDPLVLAAAKAVGRRGQDDAAAMVRPWTFATDGGWSHGVFGIPTIGFAPGEERYAHTNRERLDVEEARWAFGKYHDLILALQAELAG